MSTKFEGRTLHYDVIDDIVESSALYPMKKLANRNYSNYPSLQKPDQHHHSISTPFPPTTNEQNLIIPRSNSSLFMSNDERRKELDLIIKQLYDGKLINNNNNNNHDDHLPSSYTNGFEPLPTTMIIKNDKENKNSLPNTDLFSSDGDPTSLQRELQEKELDTIHLRKEIQELQLENKLLKSKMPSTYSNNYSNNNPEIESIRREKEILENELHTCQEFIAKFQQQTLITKRSNKIDEITIHQKEALEKKLKTYEKQIHLLINENEKLKQHFQQTEKIIIQLKRVNDDLQQKLAEAKKKNDELFYQEFNAIKSDLKILKQRNNELIEENLRLQQQRTNPDSKHLKINRSESPALSEGSDSTNYLTTVSIEHYNTRPAKPIHRSMGINGNHHNRTTKYNSSIGQDTIYRNKSKSIEQQQFHSRSSKTKYTHPWNEENIQINDDIKNYADSHQVTNDTKPLSSHYSIPRNVTLSESQNYSRRTISDTNNQKDDRRQSRRTSENISPRRPYAPSSIKDIHLSDLIKFSRPGGKISKGIVKYIGPLPDKHDHYLGLELEEEESKHDGVYQNQRLFQCKPNKGVFVAFNKVIMAWHEQ